MIMIIEMKVKDELNFNIQYNTCILINDYGNWEIV